jgi:hypothetical protein
VSANSSAAFLCETTDGRSPRVGATLSQQVYGTATRLVVSGSPCRVGEVNCVVVNPGASAARAGSIRLICDDAVAQNFVQLAESYSPVDGLATNEDTSNISSKDVFAPWQNNGAPSGLDVFATHLGRTVWQEFFVSLLTSSLDGEVYANTLESFSVMLLYAGDDRVVAGYYDGFGVVMYATAGMPPGSPYIDARPLRTPVFSISQTSEPLRPIGPTTTQLMGTASAQANRVGAMDRKSSVTATGPVTYASRQSNACDNNSFTFAQRKVDRSFLQDSHLWKYGTRIALSIQEQYVPPSEVIGPGASFDVTPDEGNIFAGAWQETAPNAISFPGLSINKGATIFGPGLQTVSCLPGGLANSRWLSGVDLSLSHTLNDGTKTFPSEWHCFENWSRSAAASPALSLASSLSVSHIFRTQGAAAASIVPTLYLAEKTVDALNSFNWSSYYVIGTQLTREPRKVQASFYILQSNQSAVTVTARLRFTWETKVVFFRSYYSLTSTSLTLLPPEQTFYTGPDYRVDATYQYGPPSVACTRRYAGVASVVITDVVPIAKWRQFAQGEKIEITDGSVSSASCGIQLQSA